METTVIYYTSNREDEEFEKKIRNRLWEAKGNLPLISVSQKPIDFGLNVCVGDRGVSEQNILKQMLMGCELAKTPFVIFAEADTLYPKEYFNYLPNEKSGWQAYKKREKRYWFEPVYILYPYSSSLHNSFYLKGRSDCAHMAGREYVISLLKEAISKGRMMKYRGKDRPIKVILNNPIINIKTGHGMRPKTQTFPIPVLSLPYWGNARDLREELLK